MLQLIVREDKNATKLGTAFYTSSNIYHVGPNN